MQFRENILNYLENKLKEITTDNGYNTDVKTVTRKQLNVPTLDVFEFPCICIADGDETREYFGQRVLHHFNVILKCWVYDENNVSTKINLLLEDITNLIANDLFLGNNSDQAVFILNVETDEGYLFPFGFMELTIKTTKYRFEQQR